MKTRSSQKRSHESGASSCGVGSMNSPIIENIVTNADKLSHKGVSNSLQTRSSSNRKRSRNQLKLDHTEKEKKPNLAPINTNRTSPSLSSSEDQTMTTTTGNTPYKSNVSSAKTPITDSSHLPMKKRTSLRSTYSECTPITPGDDTEQDSKKRLRETSQDDHLHSKKKRKKSTPSSRRKQPTTTPSSVKTPSSSTKKKGDVFEQWFEPTHSWKIISETTQLFSGNSPSEHIFTMIKNSKAKPSEKLSEKLYSSLKYVIIHKVDSEFFNRYNQNEQLILCRIHVVNPENGSEILRNNNPILDGCIETSLRMDTITNMKIQFTSCSSHHNKSQFALRIHYYSNADLKNPILIKESSPFLVYARKKTNSDEDEGQKTRSKKKRRRSINLYPNGSPYLNHMANHLDKLKCDYFEELDMNEKDTIRNFMKDRFFNDDAMSMGNTTDFTDETSQMTGIDTLCDRESTRMSTFSAATSVISTPISPYRPLVDDESSKEFIKFR